MSEVLLISYFIYRSENEQVKVSYKSSIYLVIYAHEREVATHFVLH